MKWFTWRIGRLAFSSFKEKGMSISAGPLRFRHLGLGFWWRNSL
jgi:hypothetical protein